MDYINNTTTHHNNSGSENELFKELMKLIDIDFNEE